jgi:hypothetical protein
MQGFPGFDIGLEDGQQFGFGGLSGDPNDGMNARSSRWRKDMTYQRYHERQQHKWLAGKGMKKTVQGAQAAGLHPLFALGYQGLGSGAGAPMQIGSAATSPTTGSYKAISPMERAAVDESQARAELYRAQKDQIDWDFENSKTARLRQALNSQQDQPKVSEPPSVQAPGHVTMTRDSKFATSRSTEAEEWERRYGELGGIIGGIVNAGMDIVKNTFPVKTYDKALDHNIRQKQYRKARKKGYRQKYKSGYGWGSLFSPNQRGSFK